jgi:hypothetical protein
MAVDAMGRIGNLLATTMPQPGFSPEFPGLSLS